MEIFSTVQCKYLILSSQRLWSTKVIISWRPDYIFRFPSLTERDAELAGEVSEVDELVDGEEDLGHEHVEGEVAHEARVRVE